MQPLDWAVGDVALSLGRVSDSQQTSIPAQHDINRATSVEIGLPIPEDGFYDDVASRTKGLQARQDFQACLERLEDPHVKALLIWNDSRLLGDEHQAIEILNALFDTNTRLFVEGGYEIESSSRESILTGIIKGWQNKNEVLRTRERVASTHLVKARAGRLISRPPYAIEAVPLVNAPCEGSCKGDHKNCSALHGELSKKNTVWIVNAERMNNVKFMIQYMRTGTMYGLVKELELLGIRTPVRTITRSATNVGEVVGGTVFTDKQVRDIVTNEFYTGLFTWHKTYVKRKRNRITGSEKMLSVPVPMAQWIREPHALGQLVDKESWTEAQRNIKLRSSTRDEQRVYDPMVFDRLVECGRCGWTMSPRRNAYKRKDGGSTWMYQCDGPARPSGKCTASHQMPVNGLWFYMGGILEATQGVRLPKLEVTFSSQTEGAAARQRLTQLEKSLLALDEREERDEELFRFKNKSMDWLRARTEEVDTERAALRAEVDQCRAVPPDVETSESIPEALKRLVPALQDESIDILDRQQSARRLIEKIVVDRPSVSVILRQPATTL